MGDWEKTHYIAQVRMLAPDGTRGLQYVGLVGFKREEAYLEAWRHVRETFLDEGVWAELDHLYSDEEWLDLEGEHPGPEDLDVVIVAGPGGTTTRYGG